MKITNRQYHILGRMARGERIFFIGNRPDPFYFLTGVRNSLCTTSAPKMIKSGLIERVNPESDSEYRISKTGRDEYEKFMYSLRKAVESG